MSNGEVIKFLSVVGLEVSNGAVKVGGNIGVKGMKRGGDVGFAAQRKGPSKVRKIIQNDKVI